MALQTQVNQKLAFGVPGSFYDDSPRRVAPYLVEAGTIGYAFTLNAADPTKASVGGAGVFAGIAVNSKEYVIAGLTPTLTFAGPAVAQLCTMGHINVVCDNAVTIGNAAFYNTTTGELHAAAAGAEVEGYAEIPGSKFIFVSATQGEVAVLQLG